MNGIKDLYFQAKARMPNASVWNSCARSVLLACLCSSLIFTSEAASAPALPNPNMTYLDNGQVRIGMDLSLGGAVTFMSSKAHPANIINSADLGRQIQMSHYSGPWPFVAGDKQPSKAWAGLGWNPIQTGDCYMNPSKVIEHRNTGKQIYIKCIPMQWPHDNVPGDCTFETWTRLDGALIHMRFRCTNSRADTNVYRPCPQELPAVYTISKLSRLMSYTGERPFTLAPLTHVTNDWRKPWPWTRFLASERWAALVDEGNWGLGVFKNDGGEFHGGTHGDDRSDDPKHGSTAYVAPIHTENFDHNIVYEHSTVFMVGDLAEIRQRLNKLATKEPPVWNFKRDRQHWTLRSGTDRGFPLRGEWRLATPAEAIRIESPIHAWRAEQAGSLEIRAAWSGTAQDLRCSWKRMDSDNYDPGKWLSLRLLPGGKFRTYRIDLSESSEYRGLITGLALEVAGPGELRIQSVRLKSSLN